MQNADVARIFDELADLLEIDGANPFRVRAYRNAARTLHDLPESVADLAAAGRPLNELPGIGDDLAKKIGTILATNALPQLDELRQKIPAGVLSMMRIPGLGPKKAAALFHELGVKSLPELKTACEAGRVAELKGFGKKTEQLILEGLPLAEQAASRVLLAVAKQQADEIVAALAASGTVEQVEAAGSLRRRKETVGDLDVLSTSPSPGAPMDLLAAHPLVAKVLARGDTKQRVRLKSGLEMDLRFVPAESFGAALQYFTGSKEHNIVVRRRAQERGLKLNEYGLFRGETPVAGRTEEEVYAAVGLPWIAPELRENRGEIERAERGELPKLIELEQIRGDLHMHTTASDGTGTIREMIAAAQARGLEYIAITDHSQRSQIANGLDPVRLRQHWAEIRKVREEFTGIHVLCGVECDILENATLDLPDDVLAEADWVVASLHYGLKQDRDQIERRLLCAIRSPHVDAIGHPTARLIGQRPGVNARMELMLEAARDEGTMFEINASPSRLDLDDVQAAAARALGVPIVIDTDAHSTAGLGVMEFGVYQARRAGLEARDVANASPWKQFRKRLRHGLN